MEKSKAKICTILFVIVIVSLLVLSMFAKLHDSEFSLFHMIMMCLGSLDLIDRVAAFYRWIQK